MNTLFDCCLTCIKKYHHHLTKDMIDAIPKDLHDALRNCITCENKHVQLFGDYHCEYTIGDNNFRKRCEYSAERRHGKEQYWVNDQLIEERTWVNGRLNGDHMKWWRSNGALQSRALYSFGQTLHIEHYWEDGTPVGLNWRNWYLRQH